MVKTHSICCCATLLGAFFASAAGTDFNFNGPVRDVRPLLHHILAPRKAVDLCGTWQYARAARDIAVSRSPENGETVYALGTNRIDRAALEWTDVEVPFVVKAGTDPMFMHFFRRSFTLSAEDAARRVRLIFEEVGEEVELYVNGTFAGREVLTGIDWEVDVTPFVKAGENRLELRSFFGVPFRLWGDYPSLQVWATGTHCGIPLPVHLEISDRVGIDEAFVTTKVFPKRVFRADIVVTNATDRPVACDVAAVVRDWKEPLRARLDIAAHGLATAVVERAWADVKLWSPATPNLYDLDVTVGAGAARDAFRVRFGFREISFRQKQLALNGIPCFDLRVTASAADCLKREKFMALLKRLRKCGYHGLRPFLPCAFKRTTQMCDEAGFLVSPCILTGSGAGGKTDFFFKTYHPMQLRRVIRQQRNSPSVICWGLGGEFGGTYGGSDKKTIDAEAAIGRLSEEIDPTRPWCYYGECEVGTPLNKAGGPCPIRSVHYGTSPSNGWTPVPQIGHWLLYDLWGWQGPWDRTKPLSCSEDLYHGLLDACTGMSKWSGDHYCSREGYYRAWWQMLRWYACGNALGGLSAWEPWCTHVCEPKNPLYELWGPPIPPYLLFVREFESNVFSGESFARSFYACNLWYENLAAAVEFELAADGKTVGKWTEKADLAAGERRRYELKRTAPAVTRPTELLLGARLVTSDGRELAKEEFPFFVFPKSEKFEAPDVAFLCADDSELKSVVACGKGSFGEVGAAIASGAKRLLCDRPLTPADGKRLGEFVSGGGTVLILGAKPNDWAPLEVSARKVNFGWIRNGDAFEGLDERIFRMWRPQGESPWDWTLSGSVLARPTSGDACVWMDCGGGAGVDAALVVETAYGKGSWILCQLPLADRLEEEPAAGWTLGLLLRRLSEGGRLRFDRTLAVEPTGGAYGKLLDDFGFPVAKTAPDPARGLLVLDATRGFDAVRAERYAEAGGIVWVMEPRAPKDIPARWPVEATARTAKSLLPVGSGQDWSDFARFVSRTTNRGLMAGVSNETLLWHPTPALLSDYYKCMDLGLYAPAVPASSCALGLKLKPKAGVKDVVACTTPCGLVEFPFGKGRIVVSTIRLVAFKMMQGGNIDLFLRQLANNCGVRTGDPGRLRPPIWHYLAFGNQASSSFCRWDGSRWEGLFKEHGRLRPKGDFIKPTDWFGNGNDMRNFPVRQVPDGRGGEPFPRLPVPLAGARFALRSPDEPGNLNRSCCLLHPQGVATFDVSKAKKPFGLRRLWLLGAAEKGEVQQLESLAMAGDDDDLAMPGEETAEAENAAALVATLELLSPSGTSERVVAEFRSGEHFAGYSEPEKVKRGKIAWKGPSENGNPSALYAFRFDVPAKYAEWTLRSVVIRNTMKTAFMVVSVTAEE